MYTRFAASILSFLLIVFCIGCGAKHDGSEGHDHEVEATESDSEEWQQMDNFHLIMAETFHPYKDTANLEPIKVHAEHLAMEAEKWADSKLPTKVDNEETKAKLAKLKTDTRALADKIKAGGTDEEIGKDLTAVHDLFHEIQETWYGGGHGEHH
jgi:hypothetical protein